MSTLYNLCIFGCLFLIWKGIDEKHYEYVAGGVVGVGIFLVLKVRILKEVRNTLKP